MRKRWPILIAATLLAGGGLWMYLGRREPSGTLLEDVTGFFQVEACGPGKLIKLQDPQIPLRALRWVGPLPGGLLAAQVLTQSDRQEVQFFKDGAPLVQVLVPKPQGVGDGFWRFAALREAAVLPGGGVALLYAAEDKAMTEAVALGLDLDTGEVRWTHRGAFLHMVPGPGKDPQLFFFGGKNPIQRLALVSAATGGAGRSGPNGAAKSLELPAQIQEVEALLPTGGTAFLASHGGGLAFFDGRGWTHYPGPQDPGVKCQDWRSSLVRAGNRLWWQAVPGKLVEVRPDGKPLSEWDARAWVLEEERVPDARLLRLLGADGSGALWFALASPQAPVPPLPGAPQPPAQEASLPGLAETGPQPALDWTDYAAKGLDRIYRWDEVKKRMDGFQWSRIWPALQPPPYLAPPGPAQALRPESGALLVEGSLFAWYLPLGALPFQGADAHAR